MHVIKNIKSKIAFWKNAAYEKLENPTFARRFGIAMMAFGVVILSAKIAAAFTAPAADTFAYTVYDVAINQMLNGAVGFVGGVGAMALGAVMAIQQKIMLAVPCILGGAALLNAESLVTALGLTF
jgi:hypothetical protein